MESISSGQIGTRHWTGKLGAAAVVATEECTNNADIERLLLAPRDTKVVLDGRACLFPGRTVLNPDTGISLLTAPYIYILRIETS